MRPPFFVYTVRPWEYLLHIGLPVRHLLLHERDEEDRLAVDSLDEDVRPAPFDAERGVIARQIEDIIRVCHDGDGIPLRFQLIDDA